jgi:hypothetical protein
MARRNDILLPCTTLAGCPSVCIRRTAQSSTKHPGLWPRDGSLQRTSKSLQRIPTRSRGVSSGARHSTKMSWVSPSLFIISNGIELRLTTRVRCNCPSIMSRLEMIRIPFRQGTLGESSPMRLHQWAGEFPSYSSLPLYQFLSRFGVTLAFVHVRRQCCDFSQGSVKRIVSPVICPMGC